MSNSKLKIGTISLRALDILNLMYLVVPINPKVASTSISTIDVEKSGDRFLLLL